MKRLLIVVLFALTFCFTASAQGYVGVDLGYGMWTLDDSYSKVKPSNTSIALNFGKGYDGFRWEGSLGYTMAAEDKDIEYQNLNAILNIYYDIKIADAIAVYPTVGVGFGILGVKNTLPNAALDDSQFGLVYQLGVGARYNISDSQSIDFTARYIDAGEPDYKMKGYTTELPIAISGMHVALGYKYWF